MRQDDGLFEDPDGLELPDLEFARAEAADAVREVVAECLKTRQALDVRQVEICDDAGKVVTVVPFPEVSRAMRESG